MMVLVISLLALVHSSFVYVVWGQPVENSLIIRFRIISGQELDTYYVGDHFWYDIELENNGTVSVSATFTVLVYNASGHVIPPLRNYERSLDAGEKTRLYPNYTREGKEEVNIFFFDTAGAYKIDVISSIPVAFYQYLPNGRYTVQFQTCTFYFDVMPAYEKVWRDRMERWFEENEQWIQESKERATEERKTTEHMFRLTELMFLATVVNLVLVVWAAPTRKGRGVTLILCLYLAFLLGFGAMVLLGIPTPWLGG